MKSLQPPGQETKVEWDIYEYLLYTHLHIKKIAFSLGEGQIL